MSYRRNYGKSKRQRNKISQFQTVTCASAAVAEKCLIDHSWNVDQAVSGYYTNSSKYEEPGPKLCKKKLNTMFDKYENCDATEDDEKGEMSEAGVGKFMSDVGVKPDELMSVGLQWMMKCQDMAQITRIEFMNCFGEKKSQYAADNITDMKKKVSTVRKLMSKSSSKEFLSLYEYSFKLIKEDDRKTLDKADGIQLWDLMFKEHFKFQYGLWKKYIISQEKMRTISSDLWNLLIQFFRDNDCKDLSTFEDDGCWPSVIDDFVEHLRESGEDGKQ